MKPEEARARINQLSEELLRHQYLYYVKALPEIEDIEYDALFDELQALEEQFPEFAAVDSPTKRVGSDLEHTLPEAPHTVPVLSLDKCYDAASLSQWTTRIIENNSQDANAQEIGFTVEEKLDGSSIVLYYQQGQLQRAVTRGNGRVGNDITENVMTIYSVPLRLTEAIDIAVRGEIFMAKAAFDTYNKQADGIYANPRNLAAGLLRSVRSSSVAKAPLDLFIYEGYIEGDSRSHIEVLAYLNKLGFKLNPSGAFFSNAETLRTQAKQLHPSWDVGDLGAIENYLATKNEERNTLSYEIDGLVIKVNEQVIRERVGYTAHHPRWAIAYKFESPRAVTKLLSITVQVGRNGRITPVAELEPVFLAGSTISRATLHNQDYINQLELSPGDVVAISKRGDVIPAVEEVIEKDEGGGLVWKLPSNCPTCNTELIKDGAHQFCSNRACPDRVKGRLLHFVGKAGMDIDGLGEKTVITLIDIWNISEFSDLYTFDYSQLEAVDGFGPKKISLIQDGLEKSKQKPFHTFLAAIGIETLGARVAELLVRNGFDSMQKILDAASAGESEEMLAIDGFGETIMTVLIKEFNSPELRKQLSILAELGLPMQAVSIEEVVGTTFEGQRWCVTGSFENFKPRDLAKDAIKKGGGQIVNAISGKVTHLLAGAKAGSKLKKAKDLGIKIVDEESFMKMLSD